MSLIRTKIEELRISSVDAAQEVQEAVDTHSGDILNPHSVTKTQVGLSNVDNTSDANKPVSTATQTALDLKANQSTTYTKTETDNAIAALVDSAPTALNTLNELAAALGDDINFSTTVATNIGTVSSNLSSHSSDTSNPHSVTKTQVGLGLVDNTADASKPVSTATQTALDLKADSTTVSSHTGNTSNPHSVTKTQVGLSNVDNTNDASKPVSTAQQTALNLKANLASPTFTGTVSGITATMVGLGSVDNTADTAKPVSTAQQTALNLKANLASPTFTGTVTAPTFSGALTGNAATATNVAWSGVTSKPTTISGYGITDRVIRWVNSSAVEIYDLGRTIRRPVGADTNSWDSQAYTTESYAGDVCFSFKMSEIDSADANHAMIGFNTDPAANASYETIDYCWYVDNGSMGCYESASSYGNIGTWNTNSTYSIERIGTTLRYLQDGVVKRTVTGVTTSPFYVDSSFHSNIEIRDISITTIFNSQKNGTTANSAVYKSTDIPAGSPTGWYWILIQGTPYQFWVEMNYDGGGWVLVGSHCINVAIPGLSDSQARTTLGAINGSSGFNRGVNDQRNYSTWVSINTWDYIIRANNAGKRILYHCASSIVSPGSSDNRRSSWTFDGFNSSTGAFIAPRDLINIEGGSTPGFYSYHMPYSFSTTNGSTCPQNYGNFAFWYGSCWDGSFGGGNGQGGHANAAFWTGSSGDYYTYGGIYVR